MGRFLEGFVLGAWQANCYLLGDLDTGRCVVVDPGQDGAAEVLARLATLGVECDGVLLTHGHLDHLWSAPVLAQELDVEVLLHPEDHYLYRDPTAAFHDLAPGALKEQFGLDWQPDERRLRPFHDGEQLHLGGLDVTCRHTPGHTPGSSVFLVPAQGALLLSGDLIFAGALGRTDLPRGDHAALLDSIARVVAPLDDDTVIASGHGPRTTVGRERRTTSYV